VNQSQAASMRSFMMGQFEARFPVDRSYATTHMWSIPAAAGRYRIGFTAYAVRLLQDVYFLDWTIESGTIVKRRQAIGSIESKKAESELFVPEAGTIEAFNEEVLEDPALINADPYDRGWLFELHSPDAIWLSPDAYMDHLVQAWEVAQRTIKGQANADG
jgi:glycine cleavage system H protein